MRTYREQGAFVIGLFFGVVIASGVFSAVFLPTFWAGLGVSGATLLGLATVAILTIEPMEKR